MGLETGTYINDLVTTNPVGGTDAKSEGDDHIRLIKSTLKSTFPGMAGAVWRHQAKTGDYTLQATDTLTLISCTNSPTITTSGITATNGFYCLVKNAGTGTVTIGGVLYPPGMVLAVQSNGSAVIVTPFTGWVFLSRLSAAATNVTFTGLSTTAFSAYKLIGRNVTVDSGNAVVLRLGNGSVDSGSNYSYAVEGHSSGNVENNVGAEGVAFIAISNTMSNGTSMDFELTLFNVSGANLVRTLSVCNFVNASADYAISSVAGVWSGSSGADRIQFLGNTGNLVGGTFHLYGVP